MIVIEFLIPVFNEEDNVPVILSFLQQIKHQVDPSSVYSWRVTFCDNCSQDSTLERIRELCHDEFKISYKSFAFNYGFHYSTSFLLSNLLGDIGVLIPADFQVPLESIISSLDMTLNNQKSTLLCRTRSLPIASIGTNKTSYLKKLFYKLLSTLQKGSIEGYYGMGVYSREDIYPLLHHARSQPFVPFHLRMVIPSLIPEPNIVIFTEANRLYGTTGYGLYRYFTEALSILIRSSSVTKKGLQYLILSIFAAFLILAILLLLIKLFQPSLILPGFSTVIIAMLACTSINLLGIYILWIKIEEKDSSAARLHPVYKR